MAAVRIAEPPAAKAGASAVRRIGSQAVGWSSIILLLVTWELIARSGLISPFLLPSFTDVVARIWSDASGGVLGVNVAETLRRTLLGFAIAVCGGIALGLLIARNATADWLLSPLVSFGFPMPKITFLPVFILWFGVYDVSKVTMVVCDAIFPVITATIAGARGVERQILWSARNLGAKERHLWWTIVLPAALPQILSGIEVALPIALIVAVVTEMLMGGSGLGGAMMGAWRFADSVGVFAGLLELSIVGYLLIRVMSWTRRRLLIWHPETLGELAS